ncbi:MAG: DMT family transporter [Clostridia bacterium]|nr:DMT family transporter [Clostridia bacterium]
MKTKNTGLLAKLSLLVATLICGSSFIIVEDVTDALPTNALLTLRFISATILLSLFFLPRLKNLDRSYIWRGATLGVLLFLAYMFQTLGISFPENTPGKNAFLTAVYCVMVPFMAWGFSKKRPDRYNIISALMCIVGIGFVSLTADFTMGIGDILTLIGGVFYALHIIAVSRFSIGRDALLLTIIQFAASGICALTLSLTTELPKLASVTVTTDLVLCIAYLAVFCTTIALTLQNFGQKYTDPSTASIILSLESVFGVAFSVALGREALSTKMVLGFALIFIAVIISETKLAFVFKKKQ